MMETANRLHWDQYLDDMTMFWEWLLSQPDVSKELYDRIRTNMPNVTDYKLGA